MNTPIFDINAILRGPVPEDTTLDIIRGFIMNSPVMDELGSVVKLGRFLQIKFLYTKNSSEVPGTMTIGEFRKLAKDGLVTISIDDEGGGGGKRVNSPEPELVG